jgi:hypothetical protein
MFRHLFSSLLVERLHYRSILLNSDTISHQHDVCPGHLNTHQYSQMEWPRASATSRAASPTKHWPMPPMAARSAHGDAEKQGRLRAVLERSRTELSEFIYRSSQHPQQANTENAPEGEWANARENLDKTLVEYSSTSVLS